MVGFMSGIFFTKDQIVSITGGGVEKSSCSNLYEHEGFYIEEMNSKNTKELLENINKYINKYSSPGYRPNKYKRHFSFIVKPFVNKSSYYDICRCFLSKENYDPYNQKECEQLVFNLIQYKQALIQHQLNINQTNDLKSQLLDKLNHHLKKGVDGNYSINSGSNNKDVFTEEDSKVLLYYKGLSESTGDYSHDFQMKLSQGIIFILDKERDYNQGIDDVKKSIRENIENYNKDLTNFLEFFQKHNIELPDGKSKDDFKLVIDNSILSIENLSILKDKKKVIDDDFKEKEVLLRNLYHSYIESTNQYLDNKISEKQKKLLTLIYCSPNDLEMEYIRSSNKKNSYINYKKGYLNYLNKKIIDTLVFDSNNLTGFSNESNIAALELRNYIIGYNKEVTSIDDILCPILLESYKDLVASGKEQSILMYKSENGGNVIRTISKAGLELLAEDANRYLLCPINKSRIKKPHSLYHYIKRNQSRYLGTNTELIKMLKNIPENLVTTPNPFSMNNETDDYIEHLESQINNLKNVFFGNIISESKRNDISLAPIDICKNDVNKIKNILDILKKHSDFMDKSIISKICYGFSYIKSCIRVSLLNNEIKKINNTAAKNKLKNVIKSRGSLDCIKPYSSFLTFDLNNGGFCSISKSAKNISKEYGKNINDTRKDQFVKDFLTADLR